VTATDQFPTCEVHTGTLLLRRSADGSMRCIGCTDDAGNPKDGAKMAPAATGRTATAVSSPTQDEGSEPGPSGHAGSATPVPSLRSTLVVQVNPDHTEGDARRYFVPSVTDEGVYYCVRYVPGKALTCSCPHGRRIAEAGIRLPSPRPCRHLRAVVELEQERVA
jgi:hypothetical protein